jgi:hypothetical protein
MSSSAARRAPSIFTVGLQSSPMSIWRLLPSPLPSFGMAWNGHLPPAENGGKSIFGPFLKRCPSSLTDQTAYHHARIWASLEASGKMIGYYDVIVAATALERGNSVVTFNARHFSQVKGLTVIEPG